MLEETGVSIDPAALRIVSVQSTPDGLLNLIFCQSPPVDHDGPFVHDSEVSEVLITYEPIEAAFPPHTERIRAFFEPGMP